jgi:hypothetical protein
LESAGLSVHAPCRHVRVAHWHCEPKTHAGNNRFDRANYFDLINAYLVSHPRFGVPSNCAAAMAFDVAKTCTEVDGCGGVTVGHFNDSHAK